MVLLRQVYLDQCRGGVADQGAVVPSRSEQAQPGRLSWKPRCYTCDSLQNACPDRGKRGSKEALGQKTVANAGKMAAVSSDAHPGAEERTRRVEELRELLREAEVEDALDAAAVMMHHITNGNPAAKLGPCSDQGQSGIGRSWGGSSVGHWVSSDHSLNEFLVEGSG